MIHTWLSYLDSPGHHLRLYFLDFSKAFDRIGSQAPQAQCEHRRPKLSVSMADKNITSEAMIFAVMNAIFTIALRSLKNSGLQRGLNP